MEILLKNAVSVSADNGGSELFYAYLYIAGRRAGIVFNDENSFSTNYVPIDKAGSELIKRAEKYCLSLPPVSAGKLTTDMNLRVKLHLMMWEHVEEKEGLWFKNNAHKQMNDHLLIGLSYNKYAVVPLPEPIASRNNQKEQYYWLLHYLEGVKLLLVDGKKLLNNNISGELLEMAGLKPDQYVHPDEHRPQEVQQSTQRRR